MSWGEIVTNNTNYFSDVFSKQPPQTCVLVVDTDKQNGGYQNKRRDDDVDLGENHPTHVNVSVHQEEEDQTYDNRQLRNVENEAIRQIFPSGVNESRVSQLIRNHNKLLKTNSQEMIYERDFIPATVQTRDSQINGVCCNSKRADSCGGSIKDTAETIRATQTWGGEPCRDREKVNKCIIRQNISSNASLNISRNTSQVSVSKASEKADPLCSRVCSYKSMSGSAKGSSKSLTGSKTSSQASGFGSQNLSNTKLNATEPNFCHMNRHNKIGRYVDYKTSPSLDNQDVYFSVLATSPYFCEYIGNSAAANQHTQHLGQYINRMRGANFNALRPPQVYARQSKSLTSHGCFNTNQVKPKRKTKSPCQSKSANLHSKQYSQPMDPCSNNKQRTTNNQWKQFSQQMNPSPNDKKHRTNSSGRNYIAENIMKVVGSHQQEDFRFVSENMNLERIPQQDFRCSSVHQEDTSHQEYPRHQSPRSRRRDKWNHGEVKEPYSVQIPLETEDDTPASIVKRSKYGDSDVRSVDFVDEPHVSEEAEAPVVEIEEPKKVEEPKKKGKKKEQPPSRDTAETKEPPKDIWQKPSFSYSRKFQALSQELCDQFYNPLFNYIPRKACVKNEFASCPDNIKYSKCPQSYKLKKKSEVSELRSNFVNDY